MPEPDTVFTAFIQNKKGEITIDYEALTQAMGDLDEDTVTEMLNALISR